MGAVSQNKSKRLNRIERQQAVLELRRKGYAVERIAEAIGCARQTVYNDINLYMRKLDDLNIEEAAALRAKEFDILERASDLVQHAVFKEKDLSRIPDLIRLSEQKRRIYNLDIPPVFKQEIHQRTVVVELMSRLRDRLSSFAFAEVLDVLADGDEQTMGVLAPSGSPEGTPTDFCCI